jgi:hypothetical protein
MKYMIMLFGDQASMMSVRSRAWITEMIQFMHNMNDDLTGSGELAHAFGLADASQARTVRFQGGIPVATDGPFAESKESLAGFWIVDVESEARAVEIASRVVAQIEGDVEVRQVADRPPEV